MEIDGYEAEQMQKNAVPDGSNLDGLRVYYEKLFPYFDIFEWMSYAQDGRHPACDQSYFGRREFSFTLENDIHQRFQSFVRIADMKKALREKCPVRIDIGPAYIVNPPEMIDYGLNDSFTPVERELTFDIDISHYDDVRYCCSGADVCLECWPLMTVAIKVIDSALRDDFGFDHILWVFSGSGVHCWVCDLKAKRLNNEQRAAIADYFRPYEANEYSQGNVSLFGRARHPFLMRAYTEVLGAFFEDKWLCRQNLFQDEDRYEKILEKIPDESITSELLREWTHNRRSKEVINIVRWEQLKHLVQSGKLKGQGLRSCVEEIVLSFTFPRLDMEVTRPINHLLKAPFCIHPETGRVCVPIDPNLCDEFDPTSVPTLSQLLREVDIIGTISVRHQTSLGKYISCFRSSFLIPLLKSCKEDILASYDLMVWLAENSVEDWM